MYLACLHMGAIGPDHTNVKFSEADQERYMIGLEKRKAMRHV